jgi:hypothetical protein
MLGQLRLFRGAWVSRGGGRSRDQAAREKAHTDRHPAPYLRQGGRLQRPHDRQTQTKARFPASKEAAVREKIAGLLAAWGVGAMGPAERPTLPPAPRLGWRRGNHQSDETPRVGLKVFGHLPFGW